MRLALADSRRSLGQTWPNPPVGCVIVDAEGRLLARGRTQPGGRPHAEVAALAAARAAPGGAERLRGATAYVTLEPCAHHGKTPPCASALVQAGIARVLAPIEDPDPRVSGAGFATLRGGGVAVETGLLAQEAEETLCGFLSRLRRGRPALWLKMAATLDGRIATQAGESRWISGPEARARAHLLRAEADAVMVGAASARADDPLLTVRLPGLERRRPVRLVADPLLSLPERSALLHSAGGPVWLLHGPNAPLERRAALSAAGAELIETPPAPTGGLDPEAMLRALGARGLGAALCEGGGRLAAAFLAAGLVDRLIWVVAGCALGAEARPGIGPMALARLSDAPRFERVRAEPCGADLWTEWRPRRS